MTDLVSLTGCLSMGGEGFEMGLHLLRDSALDSRLSNFAGPRFALFDHGAKAFDCDKAVHELRFPEDIRDRFGSGINGYRYASDPVLPAALMGGVVAKSKSSDDKSRQHRHLPRETGKALAKSIAPSPRTE
ncbi:hypothetical protein [Erythrobacter sp. EC-HK427]|uniref:hypothetical protein n=1 Tax=Erythrobacter sp. EC-HK427 TaxID=2038396 RepID=UPI0018FE2A61